MPPQPSERALAWLAARGVTAGNKPLGRYNADKPASAKDPYTNNDTFDTYDEEYRFFMDKMIVALWASAPYNAKGEIVGVNDASRVGWKLAVPKAKSVASDEASKVRVAKCIRYGDEGVATLDEFFKGSPTDKDLQNLAFWLRNRVVELGLDKKYEEEAHEILQQFREYADCALMVYAILHNYVNLVKIPGAVLSYEGGPIAHPEWCRPVPKLTMDLITEVTGADTALAQEVNTEFNEKPVMPRDVATNWREFDARERVLSSLFTALKLVATAKDSDDAKKAIEKKKKKLIKELVLKEGEVYKIDGKYAKSSLTTAFPFTLVPDTPGRLFPMQMSWDEVDYLILLLFGCPPLNNGTRLSIAYTHYKSEIPLKRDGPLEVEWFAHMGHGRGLPKRTQLCKTVAKAMGAIRDEMLNAAEENVKEFTVYQGVSAHLHVENLRKTFHGDTTLATMKRTNAGRLRDEVGKRTKDSGEKSAGPKQAKSEEPRGKYQAPKTSLLSSAYDEDEDVDDVKMEDVEKEKPATKSASGSKKKIVVDDDEAKKKAAPQTKATRRVELSNTPPATSAPVLDFEFPAPTASGSAQSFGMASTQWVRQSLVPGMSSIPTVKEAGMTTINKEVEADELTFVQIDASIFDTLMLEAGVKTGDNTVGGFILGAVTDHYRLSRVPIDYSKTNEDGGRGAVQRSPNEPSYVDIMIIPSTQDEANDRFVVSDKNVNTLMATGGFSLTLEVRSARDNFNLRNVAASQVIFVK